MDQTQTANNLVEEGRRQLERGEVDAAIRTFGEATGYDGMNSAAWNDLAVALFQKGETRMAVGCLYTALKADPTFADAALNLANLLEQAGRPTDGVPGLRGVLFHDPDNADVREALEALGVSKPRPTAIVAIDPSLPTARVVQACLTEWNYLVTSPDPDMVGGIGNIADASTWEAWMRMVQPQTIIVDPAHPRAGLITAAATAVGACVSTLGQTLPSGDVLVELARALSGGIPSTSVDWATVSKPAPPLSVVVQTTHIAHAVNFLDRMATQDIPAGLFEVIITDRAYGEPSTTLMEESEYGFSLTVIRDEGAGLGEARNLGVQASCGQWIVFFDEESRPSPQCLRKHLAAQLDGSGAMAVLGAFSLHPNLVDNSFRALMNKSNLLYAQPQLIHGTVQSGHAFRANNLSVPVDAVRQVGGFDAMFTAGCEDTDLGIRLERELGMRVRYDETIEADVDYPFTIRDFQIEQLIRGWSCVRLADKHNEPSFLVEVGREVADETWFLECREQSEQQTPQAEDLAQRVIALCRGEEPYRKTGAADILEDVVRVVGMQAFNRGIAIAHAGFRLEDERMQGSFTAMRTPIVVRSGGDISATLRSLQADANDVVVYLDAGIAPVVPPEGVEIRAGGYSEAMAQQKMAQAIIFAESGAIFPAGWRETLLGELESWPDYGAVVPSADAGAASNRPMAPVVIAVYRGTLDHLGAEAGSLMTNSSVTRTIVAAGWKVVQRSDVVIGVAGPVLEKTG
jgi:hypothetical protein